ncbi:MAG: ATP phosphoribosyltransferase regulatory subunit [Alphaproteobacteria bacterium]
MSKKDNGLALLPNGFADSLPPNAKAEADAIRILIDQFSAFGYQRVKPPLVEFEESLLAPGPGERLASETFRMMDPVTHRMLGVRSDITAQIARIVSSRMKGEARPLRLTYANDVLRTRGSQMRTERQFTQVGCELIGPAHCVQTDVEVAVLSLLGLKALEIGNITLDLTIPGFVGRVLSSVEDEALQERILKVVAQRDSDALLAFNMPETEILSVAMRASGMADKAIPLLDDVSLDPALAKYWGRLKSVYDGICRALDGLGIDGVSLTLDLLEQDGFEYHKAVGFTLFSQDLRGELGRGGCYDIRFGADKSGETAKGFTLYMDTICKDRQVVAQENRVFVSCTESWGVITDLQQDGWIVVRSTTEDEKPIGCSHIYENGKVIEIP